MMERPNKEFAEKLYEILEDSKNEKIIRWSDDGRSFLLLDTIEFARSILEMYFKHKNLNSFVRQLNKYDFHKIKSTPETAEKYGFHVWEFKHACFQRQRRDLLCKIRRKRSISEKRSEYSNFDNDIAEKSILLQNQMLNSLKALSKHFQMISDDIIELKKVVVNGRLVSENMDETETAIVYEENIKLRNTATLTLQHAGFTVFVADTGNDFISITRQQRFDVILASESLENCLLVVSSIRKKDINAIIILSCADAERNSCVEHQRLGVDELLPKPYSEEMLISILKKHDLVKGSLFQGEALSDIRNLKYL